MPHAVVVDVWEQVMDSEPGPLHVLDLPQLYSKPSPEDLLSTLALLAVQPSSWSSTKPSKSLKSSARSPTARVLPEGVTSYLTKIVASPLGWIQDENEKEAIWEMASVRLAERSGRTAMPAMERTFVIPGQSMADDIELKIHEPSLTADNLGLKTWAASYMLAKRLRSLDFPSLYHRDFKGQQYQILELGSGTGLVGMAAAAVLSTGVMLTDLPDIEANLARNVDTNSNSLAQHRGFATTAVLDWSTPTAIHPSAAVQALEMRRASIAALSGVSEIIKTETQLHTPPDSTITTPTVLPTSFPVIVAADCIYDSTHPAMLVSTIATWLSRSANARVVIELPLRDAYLDDVRNLQSSLAGIGLELLEEGHESGVDDWGGDDDVREVQCWWGVWRWRL